jgi:hypothetical protein
LRQRREVRFDFSVFYNDPGIPGRDLDSDTWKKGFKSVGKASATRSTVLVSLSLGIPNLR